MAPNIPTSAENVLYQVGNALRPDDDKGFGQWVLLSQLATVEIGLDERAAAMWAAANPGQFTEARNWRHD